MEVFVHKVKHFVPPFLTSNVMYDHLGEKPSRADDVFPSPSWTFAKKGMDGNKMPQTIAHRGYKAKFPENTMASMRGAVEVGVDALETDVHLTKDGEVVISHDATLKRCYGRDEKISDCDWSYISTLRTLQSPHEPMPRLKDILEYLAEPGNESIWLLLDIKLANDAETIMRRIASAIASTPPHPTSPWSTRIVLGIWAAKFLPYCATHLPGFAITHIGFSIPYARQFLTIPTVSFNLLQKVLFLWPSGPRFIRDAQRAGRPVYAWTVDEDEMMRWCVNKGVDGVITDDPKRFREVCAEWVGGRREVRLVRETWVQVLWFNFMVAAFGWIFWCKYPLKIRGRLAKGGEEVEG